MRKVRRVGIVIGGGLGFDAFGGEDGGEEAVEVGVEDFLFEGFGDVRAVDFGELSGEATAWGVAAVEDAVWAEGGDGGFGDAGGGVAAGEIGVEVGLVLDGAQAEAPVAAGVATDEGDGGEALGEGNEVVWGGFARVVAAGFDPGVLEDEGFQLGSADDEGIERGVVAAAGDPEFDSDHRAVGDAAFEFGEAGVDVLCAEVNEAEEAVREGGEGAQDIVVLLDELLGGGVLQEAEAHVDAEAFDADAVGVTEEMGGALFRGEAG